MPKVNPKNRIEGAPETARKYLLKFGEITRDVILSRDSRFDVIIVVPVLAEYENLLRLLESFSQTDAKYHERFLVLFVVNNTPLSSDETKKENRKTFDFIKKLTERGGAANGFPGAEGLSFAVIDAFSGSSAMNEKHGGVGLARKIGLDTALAFLNYSGESKSLLFSLDADCTVSENYFTELYRTFRKNDARAGYVYFEHPLDVPQYSEAIAKYEIFLRYYVLGLTYARSPYAFFTIGSTMFSDWEAYVKTGGMNKRKAAEDFYFMEKLAKNFAIKKISNATVYPSPRTSWRVPFGTGRSVSEYLQGKRKYDFLYSPEIFDILKNWNALFFGEKAESADFYLENAKKISPFLHSFLIEHNFAQAWNKITAEKNESGQIAKQKKYWFDGFTTLKLIHYLRDACCESVPAVKAARTMLEKHFGDLRVSENPFEILKTLRKLVK